MKRGNPVKKNLREDSEIKLSLDDAKKLIAAGKIKVGWTVCTLRPINPPERCYKCLGAQGAQL